MPGAPNKFFEDPYTYQLDFSSLAAAASTPKTFQVDAASDFKLTKLSYLADIAGAAQTDSSRVVPLCTVMILFAGSGRQLMDNPVPVPNMFGTGKIPFLLQSPKIIPANSVVSVTLANFSDATTYNVRLSFQGVRLFKIRGNP